MEPAPLPPHAVPSEILTRSIHKQTFGKGSNWVAPGRTSLLKIAEGAGLDGHQQRHHSGGGATGSANAIWLKELGKWKEGVEADPILIPAIATGEWDVMTWGS